ncbi:adenosylcobalamin-dependent ribonucleoside-diphosphate reductase [Crenothrix sp.]|uniref:adenosylcobalamin-dependent ribonucleoside-diphosphate reductase n=1 Tax=Crenothrix sp. TaxID=3100433 RepID=UPI00374CDA0A
MTAQLHLIPNAVTEIAFQDASMDIWDTKYRLKSKDGTALDADIDETYQRVAKALSQVEKGKANQEKYYKEFLWALRQGVIPAGRIISNAGALEHKPSTSTINCTVSGIIADSMDDILAKVHEAGLTLKAGCVAPNTLVCTEQGYVSAQQAVTEQHQQILSYDRDTQRFEMRPILKHMTIVVPTDENIEIGSHLGTLTTSIKHPVLVYRDDKLQYVRADDINNTDALVHYQLPWQADHSSALPAWFAGAHLGDGSAYEKHITYAPTRTQWQTKATAYGKRLIFKIRAAEREVVERYAQFFQQFYACQAQVVATTTPNNTPVWDFTVASFKASAASELFDHQTGKKSHTLKVPQWIKQNPDKHFLPFLAGLIDTDGTVSTERGSAILSCQSAVFADEIQSLLALFGVHGAITKRQERSHIYNGHVIKDCGGYCLKISDSSFLLKLSAFMADSGKIKRIKDHQSQSGQYDHYVMTSTLRTALENCSTGLNHTEKQRLGFYHGKHQQATVSRVYLDKWAAQFPQLAVQLNFVRQLRPLTSVRRNLDMGETFYDFTVDTHNNYLAGNNGLAVIHNCGIGYEFSTLRPKDAYVSGAGAYTSGPLSFMDIYDKMCFTVSSAGGRRGAQMATFDVGHPDVVEFIRAKRENGRLRQFNLSLLITTEFMDAVKNDAPWPLSFPVNEREVQQDQLDLNDTSSIIWRDLANKDGYVVNTAGLVACRISKTIPARRLWDIIMSSTYDYAEPGFILIDKVNEMNNNWFCENIRATNPCGEQPLPPYGSCLLGSINLTRFVKKPFTKEASFDWETYRKTIRIFTRMLDNVVEINGLPLEKQREEITSKRRHGMGYLGLGSTVTMLGMKYGDDNSLQFTEEVTKVMAIEGWKTALTLAKEKGPAPIMEQVFTVTGEMLHKRPEMLADGYKIGDSITGKVLMAKYSRYMQQVAKEEPELVAELIETGARFTHHSSIAPTGTISLSLANNASNGIEPSFAHHYSRNVIRSGKKSKEKVDVYSFELLAYRTLVNANAMPYSEEAGQKLPDYFIAADDVTPKQHVDIQAAAQKWIDSSISKTANVPTDFPYEDFKNIYQYAYEQGLKGCTTFRFNPEVFQGVLVKESDLENTVYQFTLEDGSMVEFKGNDDVEYDGEIHSAANLFDALKEGYYGKF